jgi:serine/threonine protein kinase
MAQTLYGGKLLDQGTFGCVYHPSILCSGKEAKRKKLVSKLQLHDINSKNELFVGSLLREITDYKSFFVPTVKSCPVSLKKIKEDVVQGCNVVSEYKDSKRPFILTYMPYINNMPLGKYLPEILEERGFAKVFYRFYTHLLEGVKLMQTKNIVHYDIKGDNILVDLDAKPVQPLFIDYGISIVIDEENVEQNYSSFYIFAPSYYYWSFEALFISWILRGDEGNGFMSNLDNVISGNKIQTELLDKYFDSNPLFDIKSAMFSDNSPFSRRFVESYKRSFSDYFVGKYSDKTGRECIDDLIKTWRSWDVFSITQFFLLRSRKFASRLTEDSHHTEFFRTLYRAIKPDPRERLSIDDIIDEIDYD